MTYQHAKNKKKKLKQQNAVISIDLIRNNQFKTICAMLENHSDLTPQNRYIYGYALLRQNRLLEAFSLWWPLANKGNKKLRDDCVMLLKEMIKNNSLWQSREEISKETLKLLFSASRQLIPESEATASIEARYLSLLWSKNDLTSLEAILRSQKQRLSGIQIENLSKVIFLQYHAKWLNHMPTLIGEILTGGASLILRNKFYHSDINDCLHALSNEIMHFYTSADKPTLFENETTSLRALFVEDYINVEIHLLNEMINMALKNGVRVDIIPTQAFYIDRHLHNKEDTQLLSWLDSNDSLLNAFYHPNTCYAMQWICGFEKSFNEELVINNILNHSFHPYLSLALMLKIAYLQRVVEPSMAKKVLKSITSQQDSATTVFKTFTQNILTTMLASDDFYKNPHLIQVIIDFYPFLNNATIQQLLCKHLYRQLNISNNTKRTGLEQLKLLANAIGNNNLIEIIDRLIARQKTCAAFLVQLESDSKRKRQRNAAKNSYAILLDHLTLIADTCFLLRDKLSEDFFIYLDELLEDKKINQLISIDELIDYSCHCDKCIEIFLERDIPRLINELSLPFIGLSLPKDEAVESTSKKVISHLTLLSQANPFEILNASLTDTKSMILEKVMAGIRQKPANMAILRQAQNEIFLPSHRFIHEFFRFFASFSDHVSITTKEQLFPEKKSQISWREELLNEI